jgi:nitroreductase
MGSLDDYDRAMLLLRRPLGTGRDVREVVRFATLAANGHNTQPWRFRIGQQAIRILPDLSRRTPAVDPDDHHLYVSLGCAAENLSLAAAALGFPGEARFEATEAGAVVYEYSDGAEQRTSLCDAIPRRQSTRVPFEQRQVSVSDLEQLQRVAATPGVDLVLITARSQIDQVRDLLVAGNTLQMADRPFMTEMKSWMRFNARAALEHGDGLFSASSGNPTVPSWIGRPMFDWAFKPESENKKYAQQLATSAGLAVFVGAQADCASWYAVGRACQRFALQATALGLRLSFINQPVEVAKLRPELASVVGMPGRRPDIVMRFGYGPTLPMSPRRPVDSVIDG